jgi:hypothetical protein
VILPVTGALPHHAIGQQKHRKSLQLPPRHILLITSLTSGSMTTLQATIQHATHQHMERYPLQLRLHTQEDTQTIMHQRGVRMDGILQQLSTVIIWNNGRPSRVLRILLMLAVPREQPLKILTLLTPQL